MSLRSGLQDWFAARQAEGYLAEYDTKKARIGGFPFSVQANLTGVRFAPPTDRQGKHPWVWAPKRLDFRIIPLPWTISTLHVEVKTRQDLHIGSNTYHGKAEELSLALNWMSEGIPDDIHFLIQKAVFENRKAGQSFQIKDLSVRTERIDNGSYAFDINGERLGLPVGIAGMGQMVSEVILRGQFNEQFGANGLSHDDLTQWRDGGGTLETERIQIGYGPLLLQGNGTLALDGDMQPVGAFSARIQGFFQTVDRLKNAGVIRGPDATMAKVVLGMLSRHPSNGGPATISLPLTIQNRALFAGPVSLITLPEINW